MVILPSRPWAESGCETTCYALQHVRGQQFFHPSVLPRHVDRRSSRLLSYYRVREFVGGGLNCEVKAQVLVVTPPLFATYFQEKEGGGRNNEDLHFYLAVKPSPPRIRVLCSAIEDENSFDRHAVAVLKDGRIVGHVHVAKHSR